MIKNLIDSLPMVNKPLWDKAGLIQFERKMADHWESGRVRGPIHLSGGNEDELIEIFKYVKKTDWVFSTWRSHYHALLKGVPSEWVEQEILDGRSITLVNKDEKFYASAIVGAIIPIAVGVFMANKIYYLASCDTCRKIIKSLPNTNKLENPTRAIIEGIVSDCKKASRIFLCWYKELCASNSFVSCASRRYARITLTPLNAS